MHGSPQCALLGLSMFPMLYLESLVCRGRRGLRLTDQPTCSMASATYVLVAGKEDVKLEDAKTAKEGLSSLQFTVGCTP